MWWVASLHVFFVRLNVNMLTRVIYVCTLIMLLSRLVLILHLALYYGHFLIIILQKYKCSKLHDI